jgi:uncharacterized protein YyaL (SSP411 family)
VDHARDACAGGGFASSLDADSEGEEGKFYAWSEAEIREALGVRAPFFERAYGVDREGNWEHGKSVLNRLGSIELLDEETEAALALPSGNGMMLQVLAQLYHLTGESLYKERAEKIAHAFSGTIRQRVLGFSSLLNGMETLREAMQIVVIGEADADDTAALKRVVGLTYLMRQDFEQNQCVATVSDLSVLT